MVYSYICDNSYIGDYSEDMKRDTALKILNEVRESYDQIAGDFSRTRKNVWEEFKPLAGYVHVGDRVLDLGCGNGRLVELFHGKPIEYFGIDHSAKLIEIAKNKYPQQEFLFFDGLKIPFEDNFFDKIYCVAVLHHIPGRELRQEFLNEARRVLKPGGRLILSVWNLLDCAEYLKLILSFTFKKLTGRSKLDFFDVVEPYFGKEKAQRYIHLFRKRELKREISKAQFMIERVENLPHGKKFKNLLVIARK